MLSSTLLTFNFTHFNSFEHIRIGLISFGAFYLISCIHMYYQSRSRLLITNTKYVFSYLVRSKSREADLQAAIQYLQVGADVA